MALVKIPKYCYGEEIRNIQRVEYDDAVCESDDRFTCETESELDVHEFEAMLTDKERIVCRMKQHGYTSREIIPFVGVKSEPQMSRLLKSVQLKANLFFAV